MDPILQHYSRKDIQKAILSISKNREVVAKLKGDRFNRRPDVLLHEADILELVKQGATSFHMSVERWNDPLKLTQSMGKREMDQLRSGWDLLLDIDSKFVEYSKVGAYLVVEALKFYNIKDIFVKFSGGSGFHILVPYESFPLNVNNFETKFLYPEGVRVIASYLKEMIYSHLSEQILSLNTINEISKILNIEMKDLLNERGFNPFSVVDIDSVLISPRHLFRSPYSINEKTGLVSVPISPLKIKSFALKDAKIANITVGEAKYLQDLKGELGEAGKLILQAFDWAMKNKKEDVNELAKQSEFTVPKDAISSDFFPPCIKLALQGLKDGKKRFVFILINYLRSIGWNIDSIKDFILKWNKNNSEPLRDGYILSQISWASRQKPILPPNCDNKAYYVSIGICKPDSLCKLIKNPVNYSIRKSKFLNKGRKKK